MQHTAAVTKMLNSKFSPRFPAVVPVAVATMTPFPLLAALCLVKLREWMGVRAKDEPSCPFKLQNMDEEAAALAVKKHPGDIVKNSESSQKLLGCPVVHDVNDVLEKRAEKHEHSI